MRIEASAARARIVRLVERIAILEAALERCRTLARRATPDAAPRYCEEIEQVATAALDHVI